MTHGNFVGSLLGLAFRETPILWGIHHSVAVNASDKLLTRLILYGCGKLSWKESAVTKIVFCGHTAKLNYKEYGYNPKKMLVIPNGFDSNIFCPDHNAGLMIRTELDLPQELNVIGIVARFHPDKDIHTFVKAAGLAIRERPDLRFVMVGQGLDHGNATLKKWIVEHRLVGMVKLLGVRKDIPALLNSLDILTLTSASESCPNVIGEAMACSTPCVASDVGDVSFIVGEAGRTVSSKQPQDVVNAWFEILDLGKNERKALSKMARKRILDNFPIEKMIGSYAELYRRTVASANQTNKTRFKHFSEH